MKISNSKKQLAKIISENGGWFSDGTFSIQDKDDCAVWFSYKKPSHKAGNDYWTCSKVDSITGVELLPNWHQTILSRDEYFHLYPAPDADGWIEWGGGACPVAEGTPIAIRHRDGAEFTAAFALGDWNVCWRHEGVAGDVVAYRLRDPEVKVVTKPEPEALAEPTIEQLAADYRAKLAIAQQAQEEADSHRCGAEAALEKLVAAGKAVGLVLSVSVPEPEPEKRLRVFLNEKLGPNPEYNNNVRLELCAECGHRFGVHFGDANNCPEEDSDA